MVQVDNWPTRVVPRENSRRAPHDSGVVSPQRSRTRYERNEYNWKPECEGDPDSLDLEIDTKRQVDIEISCNLKKTLGKIFKNVLRLVSAI